MTDMYVCCFLKQPVGEITPNQIDTHGSESLRFESNQIRTHQLRSNQIEHDQLKPPQNASNQTNSM